MGRSKVKGIRDYYRDSLDRVYIVDHIAKFVSVPQSADESDYPPEIKEEIKKKHKQLIIE